MPKLYNCKPCNYKTNREQHLQRHLESKHHAAALFFDDSDSEDANDSTDENPNFCDISDPSTDDHVADVMVHTVLENESTSLSMSEGEDEQSDSQGEGSETEDNTEPRHASNDEQSKDFDWYPFQSKTELLIYIFMNSTTHPISDEVVKFVLYMMKELNVPDIPLFYKLKEKKFGSFSWEELITKGQNSDNIPLWTLKPSAILKMMISHPDTSKSIIRKPLANCEVIGHPAQAEKWKTDINFNNDRVDDLPVVHIPINLFLDDTATHKSRQWMALHCIQMQIAGLPTKERQKEGALQFLGASEKVEIMDVAQVIVNDIKDLQSDGVEGYDANEMKKCFIKSSLNSVIADFNMLSYCCNHLGAAANKYCPRCNVDSEHFMSLGTSRTPEETKRTIERINLRSSERDKKALRKQKGVKEHENVFWDLIDPHRDIPVGLLHLIPLGLAKHLVKLILQDLDSIQKLKLQLHLLSMVPGSKFQNFFHYIDSKQGKHFKEYLQLAPLNMSYAGVAGKYVRMVSYLAKIQKTLNQANFTRTDIQDLREDIRAYHQLVHQHAPELKKKAKTHLLLHVVEDIQRHGPPQSFQEDAFEKNHGTIRNIIFLQNQKARSRDTSIKFAKHYVAKHIMTGGYFEDHETWKTASPNVINFGLSSPEVRKYFGLGHQTQRVAGKISLLKRGKHGHVLEESQNEDVILSATLSLNIDANISQYTLKRGSGVTTQENELAQSGDWVQYINENENECYGIFQEGYILTPKRGSTRLIVKLQKAEKVNTKDCNCDMYNVQNVFDILSSINVQKRVNFFHDCKGGSCNISEALHEERIEQENITRKTNHLKHKKNHTVYVLNKYSFI
ncbi:uncharacterized protein LOC127714542 [Mytilus californianus]|uniref:uncharacterized protein LOC127714542 n=1 Tax=Mytilus californianus TaxID=6549 RepID=UPI0022480B0E|nr:uncharacterized protein LOC127714542 [Mytilus californianus]